MKRQQQFGFINIIPYPQGLLRSVVRVPLWLYRAGLGDILLPVNLMVLTTKGRKSGLPRHHVLEYRRHGSKLYVISAWGDRTQWVRNLLEHPEVTIQLGQREIAAQARLVTDSSEALRALYMFQRTGRLYEAILADMSSADSIDLRTLKRVANEFTLVRFDLDTLSLPELSGVKPRYRWITPLLIFAVLMALAAIIRVNGNHTTHDQ